MNTYLFELQDIKSRYVSVEAKDEKDAYQQLDLNFLTGDYDSEDVEEKQQYNLLCVRAHL